MPAPKKKSRARKRRPSRQVMEARTKGIGFLNKMAFLVLLILICTAVAVSIVPQWNELQRLEAELAETERQESEVLNTADQRNRELQAMRSNNEFRELEARDTLDLYLPGETVIRIQRD